MNSRINNLSLTRDAWNAYHEDYMRFHLAEWPDYYEHFRNGGTMLDEYIVEMIGTVKGKKLLDICCACDAKQAFSWANLGASVTACDISPVAIDIAKSNAECVGIDVDFHVADAQQLQPIRDQSFDIVFATYLMWYEDITVAFKNWSRVLRPNGKILVHTNHPVSYCIEEKGSGIIVERAYQDRSPDYHNMTGTPLANRHGGWGKSMPCVEFHHTLADILNAITGAGLRLARTSEIGDASDASAKLPTEIVFLCTKP